ncbi:MAG: hypothetical protein LBS44_05450 [Deltaproteobacteria bacterium]|jgi:hypothetical protein|nr:hypothetical protein [Deltaproteobacteria bacterium]
MDSNVTKIVNDLVLDKDVFSQSNVIRHIENPFCEVWTTVYDIPEKTNNSTSIFSCFANLELAETILNGQDWLKSPDGFSPGFSVCGDKIRYSTGQGKGYEPIILTHFFINHEKNWDKSSTPF